MFLLANSEASSKYSYKKRLVTIRDDNWASTLKGEWMIKFYAPWCPACKASEADYESFADWSEDLNIKVAVVDITKQPGLSGRFMVTALPTFFHAKDGSFRRYVGERTTSEFRTYVGYKKWEGTEELPWYRHPNSVPMSLMSLLFKTSIILKNVHELLTVTYGFAPWVSYLFFIFGTIACGLLLGMVLVWIIDWFTVVNDSKKTPQNEVEQVVSDVGAMSSAGEEGDESEINEDEPEDVVEQQESLSEGVGAGDSSPREEVVANKKEEEDEDDNSQNSQVSSQTFKSWENISEKDVAETVECASMTTEEIRKRNINTRDDEAANETEEDENNTEVKPSVSGGDCHHSKAE